MSDPEYLEFLDDDKENEMDEGGGNTVGNDSDSGDDGNITKNYASGDKNMGTKQFLQLARKYQVVMLFFSISFVCVLIGICCINPFQLFEKSRKPNIKAKKDRALKSFAADLQAHGVVYTNAQITKRIANAKQRHRENFDRNRTGNLPIPKPDAVDEILTQMIGIDNPTVNPLSFGVQLGCKDNNDAFCIKERNHVKSQPAQPKQTSTQAAKQTTATTIVTQNMDDNERLISTKSNAPSERSILLMQMEILNEHKSLLEEQREAAKLEVIERKKSIELMGALLDVVNKHT